MKGKKRSKQLEKQGVSITELVFGKPPKMRCPMCGKLISARGGRGRGHKCK